MILIKFICKLCVYASLGIGMLMAGFCFGNGSDGETGAPPLSESPYRNSKLISLNFTDIKTRQLLQILAAFRKKNVIISDRVQGNMSIHLNKATWEQAMQVVLRSQKLAQEDIEGVTLIAPQEELSKQKIQKIEDKEKVKQLLSNYKVQKMQTEKSLEELTPLYNVVIPLHYAKAEFMAKLLTSTGTSLLSPRGQVSPDLRTSSLWIRAPLALINVVIGLVKKLDHPVKQVIIETRIVTLEKPFEEELGVRFGISSPTSLSGTLAGASQFAQDVAPEAVTPFTDRLNFNLPAAPLFGTPWSVGLAVAKLGSNTFLDLELSALEREGKIQLVATPSLLTLDNQPAYIRTGEEIPYQEATSSGATAIQYKNAVLQLEVTPQVTSKKQVILNLKVSKNRRGDPVILSGGGQAIPIVTEEEQSQVLVRDTQTIVLGGIYQQDKRKILRRVPFLSSIPLIGLLFTHRNVVDSEKELLIFLTPHIVSDPKHFYLSQEQASIWHQTHPIPLVKKSKQNPLSDNQYVSGMLATQPIQVLPTNAFHEGERLLPAQRDTRH